MIVPGGGCGGPSCTPLHPAISLDSGVRIIDVWESKAAAGRFDREIMQPLVESLGGPIPGAPPPTVQELDVRNLELAERGLGV